MKLYSHSSGQGPDIVLLHGWGFSSAVWEDVVPLLEARYRVTVIDLPGFGQSGCDSSIVSLTEFSEAVFSAAPKKAIYMGWSLGGLVAQYIAIHHPESVEKLICVTSSPCFIHHEDWPGIRQSLLNLFSDQLVADYQQVLHSFLLLQFFGVDVDKQLIDHLSQQLIQNPPAPNVLKLGLKMLLETDLRTEFPTMVCPVHFIFGKFDVIVPAKLATALKKLLPLIKTDVIKGASHAPFISHPALFLETTGLLS